MRRRYLLRALLGILLLALAIGAALLSRGVARAAQDFRNEQSSWQQGVVAATPASSGLFERAGATLLGVRTRSQVLGAYLDYHYMLSYATSSTLFLQTQARSNATLELTRLRPSLASASDRSETDTTLGVIYAISAFTSGASQRQTLLGNAVVWLRTAVLEDPANARAKEDLELLLFSTEQTSAQQEQQSNSASQAHGKTRLKGKRGRHLGVTAQGQVEGSGY